MAKRKPVPPEKQKYVPVHVALKAGLLSYLLDLGKELGLQRTKVIDRIVAGFIREDIDFNQIFKTLSQEQQEMRDVLWSGKLRTAYISLHKSTVPEFNRLVAEKGWSRSMMLERMLMSYALMPENERFALLEPPEDFEPLDAKTYEDLSNDDAIFVPESPIDQLEPPEPEDLPESYLKTPPQDKQFVKKTSPTKFMMRIETGFTSYIQDYAKRIGTTKTDLVTCMIDEVAAKGLVFAGDASILNREQRELYKRLFTGERQTSYVMIEKATVNKFEKLKELTGWEKYLLMRRVFLTWLLSPFPPIKKM